MMLSCGPGAVMCIEVSSICMQWSLSCLYSRGLSLVHASFELELGVGNSFLTPKLEERNTKSCNTGKQLCCLGVAGVVINIETMRSTVPRIDVYDHSQALGGACADTFMC
eukprot:1152903-Pelagomonas_calceolata.AAC.7